MMHMLIDCGVVLGTPRAENIMTQVARDIRNATADRIDVVVATHEHWDHVSGFLQAKREFDNMRLGEVWFAWTEDPDNLLAKRLRRDRDRRIHGLTKALQQLESTPAAEHRLGSLREIVGFNGPAATGGSGRSTGDAFEYLKQRDDARIRYLRPGTPPMALEGVEGVRLYVLGPPEDEQLLRRSRPTRSGAEVYEVAQTPMLEDTFLAALPHLHDDWRWKQARERSRPFEEPWQIPLRSARARRFFRDSYGFGHGGPTAWRRIDADWLTVAEELALNLDNDTNNTSVVLAIELVNSGRVILMAADAQIGNWESWGRYQWQSPDLDGKTKTITSADLLRRTVLYKVGHHGSHNATLRTKGLELMDHPELTAMIPVDAKMAARKHWNMPFPKLLRRLRERSQGRVIRSDQPLPEPAEENAAAWCEFRKRTRETGTYVDYIIPL